LGTSTSFGVDGFGIAGSSALNHAFDDPAGGGGAGSSDDPSGYSDTVHYYRVTSRSTGGTENLIRVLESTFVITD